MPVIFATLAPAAQPGLRLAALGGYRRPGPAGLPAARDVPGDAGEPGCSRDCRLAFPCLMPALGVRLRRQAVPAQCGPHGMEADPGLGSDLVHRPVLANMPLAQVLVEPGKTMLA